MHKEQKQAYETRQEWYQIRVGAIAAFEGRPEVLCKTACAARWGQRHAEDLLDEELCCQTQ